MRSCAGQCCSVALFTVKVVLYLRNGGAETPCMWCSDGIIYMQAKGFDIDNEEVSAALKAAWETLDLQQITAGIKLSS